MEFAFPFSTRTLLLEPNIHKRWGLALKKELLTIRIRTQHLVASACIVALGAVGVAGVQAYTSNQTSNSLPLVIPYQGTLSKDSQPFNGTQTMTFKLYTSPTDGIPRWTSNPRNVEVVGGKFAVTLGDSNDTIQQLSPADFRRPSIYISVTIDNAELLPRQRIAPAPQAISASQAAEDFSVVGDVIIGGSVQRSTPSGGTRLMGTYCGSTNPTSGKVIYPLGSPSPTHQGLQAAQRLCSDACNSPTAHMCTSHEMMISGQFGVSSSLNQQAWIGAMSYASFYTSSPESNKAVRDCAAMSSDDVNALGVIVTPGATGPIPTRQSCDASMPIACCD